VITDRKKKKTDATGKTTNVKYQRILRVVREKIDCVCVRKKMDCVCVRKKIDCVCVRKKNRVMFGVIGVFSFPN